MRAPRRPHYHASPPKKRRGQHNRHPSASPRPVVRARQEAAREPIAPRTTGMTAQRREDHTMTGGDAPRALSPTARLLPHGLFASRGALPFGLDNATASLARAICPSTQTYVEIPMVLPRDPEAQQPTSELPDFSQVRGLRRLGPGRYTITSLRQRLLEEGRGCFYAPSRTPARNLTATTLLGSASIPMERWKPLTRHKTPLRVGEPLVDGP